MSSLQLAQTDDLVKELASRYEHFVFAGLKHAINDADGRVRSWRYAGNTETCQGLACGLIAHIQQDADANEEVLEPGEL